MSIDNPSGLQCLKAIFSQVRRGVNFTALLTKKIQEDYNTAPESVLLKLSADQGLRPEQTEGLEIFSGYGGPALVQLKNNNWVVLPQSKQFAEAEFVAVFDPLSGKEGVISVARAQLLEQFSGKAIIFHNLAQVDSKKQTRLTSFIAIAQHHNTRIDIREIMHEYAVGEEEVKERHLRHIAADYKFKSKEVKLSWKKLEKAGTVLPCIAVKRSGKYAVLCGMRTNDDKLEAVLMDPEKDHTADNRFIFLSEEQYKEEFTGKLILLKKIFSLTDEEQPFSLRWFIPEFIKNKGIFGKIALMVLMLTIFSLIIPLFFQIVVDKVLVNQAYNTLNVLGIGILIAVLFNTVVSFARSYMLLFAANKIDISTATKTFARLMKLPVDFFDRVPSGVLLKHMQQTEKIRGFLSGNLFFTILDLCALCIFIPFLLFYSVPLTLIVIGFSALMALVVACLIKPFQKRLDELYQAEGKRQSMLVETIHGIKTVKSLALEPVEKKIWDDSTAYAIKSHFRVGKISMTAQSLSQMLEMMMMICVIWVGTLLVSDGIMTMVR